MEKIFDYTRSKQKKRQLHASQNRDICFLGWQLPNLDCYYHWKSLGLRNIYETFKARYNEISINIQTEARELVSYNTKRVFVERG